MKVFDKFLEVTLYGAMAVLVFCFVKATWELVWWVAK